MDYKRPAFLFNRHLETIYPALFRTVNVVPPTSERVNTPDHDFIDLDWYCQDSEKLVIISHGLEGNSKRAYVLGMVSVFSNKGFDVLAWNYRGCSPEINLTPRFYHSGATDDLDFIVQQAIKKSRYKSINLIGFSLGGNLTLKYLGENYNSVSNIDRSVVISVPLHLDSSCSALSKKENIVYVNRFLKSLKAKVRAKAQKMNIPNLDSLNSIKTLRQFDDYITGPLHGFKDAANYYAECSAINFLSSIKTPTLVINAKNDPFLSPECYPQQVKSNFIKFLYPMNGGHVGFTLFNKKNIYWSEIQALDFITANNETNQ